MKQIVKKKMTVKQVENLSEKEKNEYQWTLSKTVEVPGKNIIKPDKDKQPTLRRLLMRVIDDVELLKQAQKDTNAKVDEVISTVKTVIQLNNLKTK